jgi:hypothetical protein
MAVDDGHWCVISSNTHTKVLETSLALVTDEPLHELVLLDHHTVRVHERRVVTVGVDADRRYRTVGEQPQDPCLDVAS